MKGCVAPSEVPGVTVGDMSAFGAIAEELVYADFCTRYSRAAAEVFRDADNPSAYLYFLATRNPQFTQARQTDYYARLRGEGLMRIPDFVVHTAGERAFYELKPDSASGLVAGTEKVGTLRAVYAYYGLPYVAGATFTPREHALARLGAALEFRLRTRRVAPGLLAYTICLSSEQAIDIATLVVLLRLVIREANKQRRSSHFRPVDLTPAFAGRQQFAELARTLGIPAVAATGVVGWRYFWKAVAKRFALRGGAAAALAAADGPLPVGDLIAAGIAVWTVVDIVRLSDELWRDARVLRDRGA
jgi:hypothetical protein